MYSCVQCKQENDLVRSEILIELQPLCDEWRPRCVSPVVYPFGSLVHIASTKYVCTTLEGRG